MEHKQKIDKMVEETLETGSRINQVQPTPFFKEKVLNRALNPKRTSRGLQVTDWIPLRYQAAALIAFVLINTFAVWWYTSDTYDRNITYFAETFGLSTGDDASFFNLNQNR